ncbi:MAG TPA: redoxin family protein [Methanosarcina sp.]|nr:redoxin family protein [Methanosarcina sp.]
MSNNANPSQKTLHASRQNFPWIIRGLILSGIILLAAALIGFLLINQPDENAVNASLGPVRAGMKMPDFTLKDIHGTPVRLSDYRGKTVLINTWATWCPPCRAEMPYLNAFYQQQRSKNFEILAINAGESQSLAASFAGDNGMKFPVLLDPDEKLMDQLSIHDFPTSILVGKDGLVKTVHVGMFTSDALSREITPFLQ